MYLSQRPSSSQFGQEAAITALNSNQIGWLEYRFTKEQVDERGVICLNDEEEDLFRWYGKESRSNNNTW